MASERDDLPLEGLRNAWQNLTPPPPADGIEESDPETRAVVGWMRAAFESVETPPVPVFALRRSRRRARLLPMPLAAAASALIAVGLWGLMHRGQRPEEPGPIALRTPAAEAPVIAALGPDHIEMRSGPVRLVLFQPADGSFR